MVGFGSGWTAAVAWAEQIVVWVSEGFGLDVGLFDWVVVNWPGQVIVMIVCSRVG